MFEEDGKWIQMINSECKTGKTQGALVCTSTGSVQSTTSFLAFYCPRVIARGIFFLSDHYLGQWKRIWIVHTDDDTRLSHHH